MPRLVGTRFGLTGSKYAEAEAYVASPVLNRAPKRSPTQRESDDVVVRALRSEPRNPTEMLQRVAASLPPGIALTYSLLALAREAYSDWARASAPGFAATAPQERRIEP